MQFLMDSHYKPRDIHITVQSWNKAYKNSAKVIPKLMVRPEGVAPSEYAADPPPDSNQITQRLSCPFLKMFT